MAKQILSEEPINSAPLLNRTILAEEPLDAAPPAPKVPKQIAREEPLTPTSAAGTPTMQAPRDPNIAQQAIGTVEQMGTAGINAAGEMAGTVRDRAKDLAKVVSQPGGATQFVEEWTRGVGDVAKGVEGTLGAAKRGLGGAINYVGNLLSPNPDRGAAPMTADEREAQRQQAEQARFAELMQRHGPKLRQAAIDRVQQADPMFNQRHPDEQTAMIDREVENVLRMPLASRDMDAALQRQTEDAYRKNISKAGHIGDVVARSAGEMTMGPVATAIDAATMPLRPEGAVPVRKQLSEAINQTYPTNPALDESLLYTSLPQGAVSMGLFALGAAAAGPNMVGTLGAAIGLDEGYQTSLQQEDVSLPQATALVLGHGALGATEAIPFMNFMKQINRGTGNQFTRALVRALRNTPPGVRHGVAVVGEALAQTIEEGSQEYGQSFYGHLLNYAVGVAKDPSLAAAIQEAGAQGAHGAAAGAILGSLMGGGASAIGRANVAARGERIQALRPPGATPQTPATSSGSQPTTPAIPGQAGGQAPPAQTVGPSQPQPPVPPVQPVGQPSPQPTKQIVSEEPLEPTNAQPQAPAAPPAIPPSAASPVAPPPAAAGVPGLGAANVAPPWSVQPLDPRDVVAELTRQSQFSTPRVGESPDASQRRDMAYPSIVGDERNVAENEGFSLVEVPVEHLTTRGRDIDPNRQANLEAIGGTRSPIVIMWGLRDGKTKMPLMVVDNGNNRVEFARRNGIPTVPAIVGNRALREYMAAHPEIAGSGPAAATPAPAAQPPTQGPVQAPTQPGAATAPPAGMNRGQFADWFVQQNPNAGYADVQAAWTGYSQGAAANAGAKPVQPVADAPAAPGSNPPPVQPVGSNPAGVDGPGHGVRGDVEPQPAVPVPNPAGEDASPAGGRAPADGGGPGAGEELNAWMRKTWKGKEPDAVRAFVSDPDGDYVGNISTADAARQEFEDAGAPQGYFEAYAKYVRDAIAIEKARKAEENADVINWIVKMDDGAVFYPKADAFSAKQQAEVNDAIARGLLERVTDAKKGIGYRRIGDMYDWNRARKGLVDWSELQQPQQPWEQAAMNVLAAKHDLTVQQSEMALQAFKSLPEDANPEAMQKAYLKLAIPADIPAEVGLGKIAGLKGAREVLEDLRMAAAAPSAAKPAPDITGEPSGAASGQLAFPGMADAARRAEALDAITRQVRRFDPNADTNAPAWLKYADAFEKAVDQTLEEEYPNPTLDDFLIREIADEAIQRVSVEPPEMPSLTERQDDDRIAWQEQRMRQLVRQRIQARTQPQPGKEAPNAVQQEGVRQAPPEVAGDAPASTPPRAPQPQREDIDSATTQGPGGQGEAGLSDAAKLMLEAFDEEMGTTPAKAAEPAPKPVIRDYKLLNASERKNVKRLLDAAAAARDMGADLAMNDPDAVKRKEAEAKGYEAQANKIFEKAAQRAGMVAPKPETVTTVNEANEKWWNKELTPEGRRRVLKAASLIRLPENVMWQALSDENRQKLLARKDAVEQGSTKNFDDKRRQYGFAPSVRSVPTVEKDRKMFNRQAFTGYASNPSFVVEGYGDTPAEAEQSAEFRFWEKWEARQQAQAPSKPGNMYGTGMDILGAGITAGKLMTRAERINKESSDPVVKREAQQVWAALNDMAIDPAEAQRRLDAIDKPKPANSGFTVADASDLMLELASRNRVAFNGHEISIQEKNGGWIMKHVQPNGIVITEGGIVPGAANWMTREKALAKAQGEVKFTLQAEPAKQQAQAPKTPTQQKASDARKEMLDAIDELGDLLDGMVGSNLAADPRVIKATGKVIAKTVKAGVLTFAEAVESVYNAFKAKFGEDRARSLMEAVAPAIEEVWPVMQQRVPNMGPVGKVMDVVGKPAANAETFEAEARVIVESDQNAQQKNLAMRRLAEKYGLDEKQAQERVESVLVEIAQGIVRAGGEQRAIFDKLVALYDRQPRFSKRTSTSMRNQAYSTPVPLAYAGSIMAGIDLTTSVYEPTAGHGVLLLGADSANAQVNEIEPGRQESLKRQGYKNVTANDATEYTPDQKFDVVSMNPPFGALDQQFVRDGFRIFKLENKIAIKALDALKNNGRAVMILGASLEAGKVGAGDKVFMNWLYNNFNVVGNFEVSGDLYRNMGASFPVRVIVLAGRKASTGKQKLAPDQVEHLKTWDEVYNKAQEVNNAARSIRTGVESDLDGGVSDGAPGRPSTTQDAGDVSGSAGADAATTDSGGQRPGVAGGPAQTGGSTGGVSSRPGGRPSRPKVRGGTDANQDDGRPSGTDRPVAEGGQGDSEEESPAGGDEQRPPRSGEAGAGSVPRPYPPIKAISEFQDVYAPRSDGQSLETVIPKFMTGSVREALNAIEQRVGHIDKFVADQLQYSSVEELQGVLAAEQIDGVALAIDQVQRGGAMIIGDQTGIGKGRQAAAMIRYAKLKGIIPVFFTKDPKLFSDMYGDLRDIKTQVKPMLVGDPGKAHIRNSQNDVVVKAPTEGRIRAMMRAVMGGNKTFTDDHDMVMITYSQINQPNIQQQFLERLAERQEVIVILDEAHIGAGDGSMTGVYLRGGDIERGKGSNRQHLHYPGLLRKSGVRGVLYSSATYAKRPDAMPLYFRTALGSAVRDINTLVDIVKRGGVALQQVIANALAKAGQYIRREKDFTGVPFESIISGGTDEQKESLISRIDDVASMFGRIVDYSSFVVSAVQAMNDIRATTNISSSLGVSPFASVVHNYISQMLLAAKADAVADAAIEMFKKGEKPVITLMNTMESFLAEHVQNAGLSAGSQVTLTFKDIMRRALDRTMRVSEKDAAGNPITYQMSPDDLGLRAMYDELVSLIDDLDVDLPVSPIDYLYFRLRNAGIKVGEITGRTMVIDYTSRTQGTLRERSEKEIKNRNKAVNDFNGGSTDAMILNAAGSTGLSLHAAYKVKDHRPRHMLIAQPSLDINDFMQTLGRILRSGMVPGTAKYTLLSLPVEAERRPATVLASKMKSLNANTTAAADSSVGFKNMDFFNKYGDQVASNMLAADPDLALRLGIAININTNGTVSVKDDAARIMTGRMALLTNEQQREIYERLMTAYEEHVQHLKNIGEYDLEVQINDKWDAEELESEQLEAGTDPDDVFKAAVMLKRYSIKDDRKPPTAESVREAVRTHLGTNRQEVNKRFEDISQELENASTRYIGPRPAADDPAWNLRNDRVAAGSVQVTKALDELRGHVGFVLSVRAGDDTYSGMITNVKYRQPDGRSNPYRPSDFTIEIAVASPVGKLRIPMSIYLAGEVVLERDADGKGMEVFDEARDAGFRYERYVLTGNLLRAMEIAQNGRVVAFNTSKGDLITGLVMPRSWQPAAMANDPRYSLRTPEAVLAYLDAKTSRSSSEAVSDGKDLRIRRLYEGEYLIETPRSRTRGGMYFLERRITDISGDFASSGNRMTVQVDRGQMMRVAEVILNDMGKSLRPLTDDMDGARTANEAAGGSAGPGAGQDDDADDNGGPMAAPVRGLSSRDTIDVDGVQRPTTNSRGQQIHPTEDGIRNFWRWFGDSKVVDEQGRPMVMYHGTPAAGFEKFVLDGVKRNTDNSGWFGKGHYFTNDPASASRYARENPGSAVYPVYLRIANPYMFSRTLDKSNLVNPFEVIVTSSGGDLGEMASASITDRVKAAGHDGVIVPGDRPSITVGDYKVLDDIKDSNVFGSMQASSEKEADAIRALSQWFEFEHVEFYQAEADGMFEKNDDGDVEDVNFSWQNIYDFVKRQHDEATADVAMKLLEDQSGYWFDVPPTSNPVNEYVVFGDTQIKSATGNRGTFKKDDGNILASKVRSLAAPLAKERKDFQQVPRIPVAPVMGGEPRKLRDITFNLGDSFGRRITKGKLKNWMGGSYFPGSGLVTIRYMGDLDSAAHEIGHHLDDLFGVTANLYTAKPNAKGVLQRRLSARGNAMRAELESFWQHGSVAKSGRRSRIDYKLAEAMAEWVRAYLVNPKATQDQAPQLTAFILESLSRDATVSLDRMSTQIREWAGLPKVEQLISNVKMTETPGGRLREAFKAVERSENAEFQTSWVDKMGSLFWDSLRPFMRAVATAKDLRHIGNLSPKNDPTILARLLAGVETRTEDQFLHGPIDAEAWNRGEFKRVEGVGGYEWLLAPMNKSSVEAMERDMRLTVAQMIAERVVERADVMDKRDFREVTRKMERIIEKMSQNVQDDATAQALADWSSAIDQAKTEPDVNFGERLAMLADSDAVPMKWRRIIQKMISVNNARKERLSGTGGGMYSDLEQAKAALQELRKLPEVDRARIREAASRYRQWADAMVLQPMLASGRISQEQYQRIKEDNQFYVNMQRTMEDLGLPVPVASGKRLGTVSKVIQKFVGSTREIQNPYVSLLAQATIAQREASRNAAMVAFRDLLSDDRDLHEGAPANIAAIGYKTAAGDENTITIYVNGEPEYWKFEKGVHQALKGFGQIVDSNMALYLLQLPARLMRSAVTHSPGFIVRNVIRDTVMRSVISRSGSKPWDLRLATEEEASDLMVAGGGQFGHYMKDRHNYYRMLRRSMMDMVHDRKSVLILEPGKLLRAYDAFAKQSEVVNRVAEYRRTFAKAKAEGLDDVDAMMLAAYESRDLLDFAQAGTVVKWINQFVPFTNAAIQGMRRTIRAASEAPGRSLARWSLYVLLPEMIAYAWNAGDDDREEEYQSLPAWQRDFFYNFKVGPDLWVRIPKPFELGVLSSGVTRMIDQIRGKENAFDGFSAAVKKSVLPVDENALAGPMRIPVEMIANYDFFRDKNIIPPYEKDLEVGRRKGAERASRVGKIIQQMSGDRVDGRMIDHFIRAQLAEFGNMALRASDIGREDKTQAGTPQTLNMLLGIFTSAPANNSADVQWVYKRARQLGQTSAKPIKYLRDQLERYYNAQTAAEKDRYAKAVRQLAARLRKTMESAGGDVKGFKTPPRRPERPERPSLRRQ